MFFKASPSREDYEMTKKRKEFLTNGNGSITHQFEALDGR